MLRYFSLRESSAPNPTLTISLHKSPRLPPRSHHRTQPLRHHSSLDLNNTKPRRRQVDTLRFRSHRNPNIVGIPNKRSLGIENLKVRVHIQTSHLRAPPRRTRIPQRHVAGPVDDEVAVGLEIQGAGAVGAVGGGFARGPDESGGVGLTEDGNVAVAVEVHGDAEVEAADVARGGKLVGSVGPGLDVGGMYCGSEKEDEGGDGLEVEESFHFVRQMQCFSWGWNMKSSVFVML